MCGRGRMSRYEIMIMYERVRACDRTKECVKK